MVLLGCSSKRYGSGCASDCSVYCINGECDHVTGNCQCSSPTNRHGGPRCDQPCPDNCGTEGCNQDLTCTGCKPGWWAPKCDQACPQHCRLDDGIRKGCLQNNGDCNACETGYYGYQCKQSCPEHCRLDDRVTFGCPKNNNGDCNFCKNGYYGEKCRETCPENCDGGCEKNGECSCRAGFYGSGCDKNCSLNCVTVQCQKADGHCRCKLGYKTGTCTSRKSINNLFQINHSVI